MATAFKLVIARTRNFRCRFCSMRIKMDSEMVYNSWTGTGYHPKCFKQSGKEIPVSTITPEESNQE